MKYTTLGTTEVKVSKICLGTMTWGQQNSEEEGHEQMDYAVDQGINFFDTAELYSVPAHPDTQGSTERIIGTWFQKRKKRDDIVLATKIGGPSAFTKHIREDEDFSKKSINEAIEGSLKRLQTDYIDLYQIHWPARKTNFFGQRGYRHHDDWKDNILEIINTLEEAITAGKIRYFGISNETPWGLMSYLKYSTALDKPRCMSIQNPYNLLNRLFEVGLAEMAIREKCGLLAYSPMAFGLLSGKYHRSTPPSKGRIVEFQTMSRYNSQNCQKATEKYLTIAEKHGLSLAQISLAFVNDQPFVTSTIVGATSMDQLKENINSIDISLPKEVIKEINKVQEEIPNPAP